MQYISYYDSPLGKMLLAADEIGLTGVWFDAQKYFARCLDEAYEEKEIPLFADVKKWFDVYFSGKEPDILIPLHLIGTKFQMEVWEILCTIPYGKTKTYGRDCPADRFQKRIRTMSAQAVGGAVGHNPVSVIVPCHRVIGTNGSLTGYAGGIDKKIKLLEIEKAKGWHKDGNS